MRIPLGVWACSMIFDVCDNYRSSHFSVCVTSVVHTFLIVRKGVIQIMPEYKDLYYKLFNRITDIIEEMKEIQNEAEEMYINSKQDEKWKNIKIDIVTLLWYNHCRSKRNGGGCFRHLYERGCWCGRNYFIYLVSDDYCSLHKEVL